MIDPSCPTDYLLNRVTSRYRLVEKIGSGAMASVYRAVHVEIPDLLVAVKLLSQTCADKEMLRQRFRDEAAICARLGDRSPHIVQIRDFGILEAFNLPYFVMEFLRGRSLEALLRSGESLSLNQVVLIARQLCDGLKVAHDEGIIHRDLKPSNIFLSPDPQFGTRVTILDFGIAKFLSEAAALGANGPITQGYMGTPRYSSPEQLSAIDIDVRSDIYSLGLILYQLLCGAQPYTDTDREQTFAFWCKAHSEQTPRPMAAACPERAIPEQIEQIVLRCLAKRPEERPNLLEVSYHLQQAIRDQRRHEEEQVLEDASQLAKDQRWPAAIAMAQNLPYDSPLYLDAQLAVRGWQLEAEYQRVLDQARELTVRGDIIGLVRAISCVGSIPITAAVFAQAQAESQSWVERVLATAEALAAQRRWNEALQRAELVRSLPGASQRINSLMVQWHLEQQAEEVFDQARRHAADGQWAEALQSAQAIVTGTLAHAQCDRLRPLWERELAAAQQLQTAERLVADARHEAAVEPEVTPAPAAGEQSNPAPSVPAMAGASIRLGALLVPAGMAVLLFSATALLVRTAANDAPAVSSRAAAPRPVRLIAAQPAAPVGEPLKASAPLRPRQVPPPAAFSRPPQAHQIALAVRPQKQLPAISERPAKPDGPGPVPQIQAAPPVVESQPPTMSAAQPATSPVLSETAQPQSESPPLAPRPHIEARSLETAEAPLPTSESVEPLRRPEATPIVGVSCRPRWQQNKNLRPLPNCPE
ncbi:serine/threonine-protein kinase [Gloeobacter kilaueensis]|uniref:non-specific serine/threonine protein kinase n=1 Tax=Gloeobacter kilaueensis (strain ATCC BAA-2537 / CCAP 1431/1 / ULC 316 / JS1) TaxID=1183438 RepID=U5QGI5_GLOK1|nr:serine/threonine-protein kinase [Gloeobacter kilaueensis]AGY58036.1 serine/threonine protein kinase [Gloeobacter kilaueensis JS1]